LARTRHSGMRCAMMTQPVPLFILAFYTLSSHRF
jgi:hypothetical protein